MKYCQMYCDPGLLVKGCQGKETWVTDSEALFTPASWAIPSQVDESKCVTSQLVFLGRSSQRGIKSTTPVNDTTYSEQLENFQKREGRRMGLKCHCHVNLGRQFQVNILSEFCSNESYEKLQNIRPQRSHRHTWRWSSVGGSILHVWIA